MSPIDFAKQELGNEEIPRGSNWGVHVQKYLKSVNIPFAASWCMAFVYWCFDEWAHLTAHANPLVKTGGVLVQWNQIDGKYRIFKSAINHVNTPLTGDIIIFDHGKGMGHTGVVEVVDEQGIHTIEGNTNNDGSREGYEVERKLRQLTDKTLVGFIRIPV